MDGDNKTKQKLNVKVIKEKCTDSDPDIQHSTNQSLNIVINSLVLLGDSLAHTQNMDGRKEFHLRNELKHTHTHKSTQQEQH